MGGAGGDGGMNVELMPSTVWKASMYVCAHAWSPGTQASGTSATALTAMASASDMLALVHAASRAEISGREPKPSIDGILGITELVRWSTCSDVCVALKGAHDEAPDERARDRREVVLNVVLGGKSACSCECNATGTSSVVVTYAEVLGWLASGVLLGAAGVRPLSVSYTHLTLPTICSV